MKNEFIIETGFIRNRESEATIITLGISDAKLEELKKIAIRKNIPVEEVIAEYASKR